LGRRGMADCDRILPAVGVKRTQTSWLTLHLNLHLRLHLK
jgi:hypothetical protein